MEIRNLQIVTPIDLNWRFVAPRDYRTLELFLTPALSLVFQRIENTKAEPFYIGSAIMQSSDKKEQFDLEVMPQRSQNRIEQAFRNENISAFFALEDANALASLFQQERMMCRQVEIHWEGRQVDIGELPPQEYELVVRECARLNVISAFDFSEHGETYSSMRQEEYARAERAIQDQQTRAEWNKRGLTKKKLVAKGALSGACLVASGVLLGASRLFFRSRTTWGFIAASLCVGASMALGIIGKRLGEETVEHLRKGPMISYA